jgi:hypothetical protein
MPALYLANDEILDRAGVVLHRCSSMRYLTGLLTHTGQSFHPTVLRHATHLEYYCNELEFAVMHNQYAQISCTDPDGRYPVIDEKTIAECLKFLTYLKGKMEQCRQDNDFARLDDYEDEHRSVLKYLAEATNRFGRPYSFRTLRNNDYKCIHIAFERMMEKLQEHDPELAVYIKAHLEMKGRFMWRE